MSGLKQLRNRVKSIKSTQKITKAMHVVSAAKLQKVKDQVEKTNEYSEVMKKVMCNIAISDHLRTLPEEQHRFFVNNTKIITCLLLVVTSDRGLCGSFNSTIIKKVKFDIEKLQSEGKKVKLLVIGSKGIDALKSQYSEIIVEYYNNNKDNSFFLSRIIRNKIVEFIEFGKADTCCVYYNKFKNTMVYIPTKEFILPATNLIKKGIVAQASAQESHSNEFISDEYEYEGKNLIQKVISLYIKGEISYALLHSKASEEGARMSSMDNATKNAGELVDKLTVKLNRSRQTKITTELTEIISGAESV